MIRLNNVNKFFNRKKKNEIHVIDNTSFEIKDNGLIALLGPSGCGKTTLLNAIGGLDDVNSGDIFLDDERITKRSSWKRDEIRNLKIGYIFQNYNLIDNMTVFDNIAIVLKMIGIKDKEEIKEKVYYALEQVGMYRYRNRYADMLSGGERQRVGIARAIVKNPQIIIADEPTGNLDTKNTIEVMNIIKRISREKPVIMVTHEEKLANFYSTRIIRLIDGKIVSDEVNANENNLDYRIESKIYLGDIEDVQTLNLENHNIKIFNDDIKKMDIEIILKNGNIYLKNNSINSNVEIIDENSGIELVNEKYTGIDMDEDLNHSFNLDKLKHRNTPKYTSIIGPWETIKNGFKRISDFSVTKKFLLGGFFLAAMFMVYGLSSLAGALHLPDERFVTTNKEYITISEKNVEYSALTKIENMDDVAYVLPGNSIVRLTTKYDKFLQTSKIPIGVNGSITALSTISKEDIIKGRLPENKNEIALDKMTLKRIIDGTPGNGSNELPAKNAGIYEPEDFIGMEFNLANMESFKLVGLVDKNSPSIYVEDSQLYNVLSNSKYSEELGDRTQEEQNITMVVAKSLFSDDEIKLKSGRLPSSDYETILNENKQFDHPINSSIDSGAKGKKLKVVGYYSDTKGRDLALVNDNTIKLNVISSSSNMIVMPKDKANKEKLIDKLEKEPFDAQDVYQAEKEKYKTGLKDFTRSQLILAGVIILIALMEIYLMMRASFLSRIKEVGILRAIGVKKFDIYKMFFGEIFAITTLVGLPGLISMVYIVSQLMKITLFQSYFYFDFVVGVIALIGIYFVNTIFGLMPVWRVIRKTPAEILSRTDVD